MSEQNYEVEETTPTVHNVDAPVDTETTTPGEEIVEAAEPNENDETFPREYVEKLRAENAETRIKAKKADEYARRLHTALTAATGRLQDAEDLPFDASHLDDPEALEAAITELLERKPHLATRRVTGDIGQGVTETSSGVDLAGLLRRSAS